MINVLSRPLDMGKPITRRRPVHGVIVRLREGRPCPSILAADTRHSSATRPVVSPAAVFTQPAAPFAAMILAKPEIRSETRPSRPGSSCVGLSRPLLADFRRHASNRTSCFGRQHRRTSSPSDIYVEVSDWSSFGAVPCVLRTRPPERGEGAFWHAGRARRSEQWP